MEEEIKKFLEGEFLLLTISAGFQHNRIYNKKTRLEERKALQKTIKNKLSEYSVFYDRVVGETAHIKNIQRFAKEITKRHKNILYGKELRIGTAQKLLNLYLKYLWVWGKIPEPPHCPFDNKIISKIKAGNIKFTKFNSIKEYKTLIKKARGKSGNESLAVWELKNFKRDNSPFVKFFRAGNSFVKVFESKGFLTTARYSRAARAFVPANAATTLIFSEDGDTKSISFDDLPAEVREAASRK